MLALLLALVLTDAVPDAVPDALRDAVLNVTATKPVKPKYTPPAILPFLETPPLAPAIPGGHYERRCGPSGCQQVWVSDVAPVAEADPQEAAEETQKQAAQAVSRRRWFRRR